MARPSLERAEQSVEEGPSGAGASPGAFEVKRFIHASPKACLAAAWLWKEQRILMLLGVDLPPRASGTM